jgi:glycosyltransferase involved in cell wall biosynthesis
MRLGINLLALKPGRQGGVEHYARRMTAALARSSGHELVLLLPDGEQKSFADDAPGVRSVAHGGAFSGVAVNQLIAREGIDVLWSPWVSGCPLRAAVPSVVTVADLQHVHLPDNFSPEDRQERDRAYFMAAHTAHALLTFSRHTADDLVHTYGVAPERVHPIPLAPGHDWQAPPAAELVAALREAHGTGFLLYPAHPWPHKEHGLLLQALRRLADGGVQVNLVLTGGWGEGRKALAADIGGLGLEGQVKDLGSVPPATLRALYGLCGALVFPSRFEGFGMPVLEAMEAGVPVLSSNATSLPEVGGDAVLYFEAGHLDGLVDAIRRILADGTLRASLVERGRVRAREFSWPKTAAASARVFEAALAGPPPASPASRALDGFATRLEELEAEAETRLVKLREADDEADRRLAKLQEADDEADRRLAKLRQANDEAEERGAKLQQANDEADRRLAKLQQADAEARGYEALIARIVAEVHAIRELVETARPREILGLATPFEVRRVRRVVKHAVQRLRNLVSG